MSLVGIDVGSSTVKAAAYAESGRLLGVVRRAVTPQHPQPGAWEQDPTEVWLATCECLRGLMELDIARRDPPTALAISASGREIFPVDANENPLGPCFMGADTRGEEFEVPPTNARVPEPWTLECGHLRERMDPVFRLLWWRKYHPEITDRANYFLGWHEFLTLRLCGQAVTTKGLAGRWLIYNLREQGWSNERIQEYALNPKCLPAVGNRGAVIGKIRHEIADELCLPQNIVVAVGGADTSCSALGTGVCEVGTACLVSGSYENIVIPTDHYPTPSMLLRGLSVTPYPNESGLSVYAISPTGTAILDWARNLVNVPLSELDQSLQASSRAPSPVVAVPYLSGSMMYWQDGRKARGTLLGLTLSTSPLDIVKAFMEGIAYDHVNTLSLLRSEGINVDRMKATGGGTRSEWWTQLKSDLISIPIEVGAQPEPGTLGAAMLAGLASGVYDNLEATCQKLAGTTRTHYPDPERRAMHEERLQFYNHLIGTLLTELY